MTKNKNSALSDHAIQEHANECVSITDFAIDFLTKLRNPVETRIAEASVHLSTEEKNSGFTSVFPCKLASWIP